MLSKAEVKDVFDSVTTEGKYGKDNLKKDVAALLSKLTLLSQDNERYIYAKSCTHETRASLIRFLQRRIQVPTFSFYTRRIRKIIVIGEPLTVCMSLYERVRSRSL